MACYAPVAIPLTGSEITPGAPTSGTPAAGTPAATTLPTGPCTNKASFVNDVNVPDNTQVSPGQAFTKTWRVKNDGNCAWGPNGSLNALVFTGGYQMGAPEVIPLTEVVEPGQEADVSVPFTAPNDPGTYVSQWMFRANDPNAENPRLGVGADGEGALFVQIVVK
jgi:hypothetical protein